MASISLGRVGFVLRGTWDTEAQYNPLDIVTRNGNAYAARIGNAGIPPENSTETWQLIFNASSVMDTMGVLNHNMDVIVNALEDLSELLKEQHNPSAAAIIDQAILDLDTLG